ncbi:MAG TPA: DUF1207 domain-containing protein [Pirellulaceae bacterium]|nr:DUF1207 domain-containing protein [Pirellulaceae bacterium]HMO94183.1 DUF1207 domain-containing protein [Pirellulaceae bacterium]HMP71196.1 DUF1207 domain-containing protein [Pirellulaceae bacterium]
MKQFCTTEARQNLPDACQPFGGSHLRPVSALLRDLCQILIPEKQLILLLFLNFVAWAGILLDVQKAIADEEPLDESPSQVIRFDGSHLVDVSSMHPQESIFESYLPIENIVTGNRPSRFEEWHPSTEILPSGILYPSYMAAPMQARIGTQVHGVRNVGAKWDSTLGGRFGWFRTTSPDGMTIGQLDFEGSCNVRTDPEASLDVDFTDFRIGVPYTLSHGPHRFKVAWEHICSHLGDEYLLKHGITTRENYARDAIVLGYGYYFDPGTRVYGEISHGWRNNVSRPLHLQFGMDQIAIRKAGLRGVPFWAVNGLLRQETRFGGTMNLQAGWAWRNDDIGRLLRTGLFLQTGKATNFSFNNSSETQLGWGMWYDF